MNSPEICNQKHTCSECGKECYCDTYRYACPWINGDKDDVCEDCLRKLGKDLEKFV